MGCLTNGYTTVESTELLASIFSFFNVSLKGISARFQQNVYRHQLFRARAAHYQAAGTRPACGSNDAHRSRGQTTTRSIAIADFLAGVDPEIPWHVFRLLPEDEMKGAEYPSIQAIDEP